jgi:PAS domain S-box-containing protein
MNYDKMSREELKEELQKSKKYNKSDFYHINSNKEWEQIFNALPDLIAIIDVNHHIKRVNKAMADRLNIEPDDLVGNTCFSLIHGTNEPPDFCPHKELLKDMKSHSNEIPIKSLQGDFLVSVSPIFDDNGQLNGSVHIANDITEKKKLGELTRLLAAIVKSSNDAIIGKDLEGNITSWNRAAQEMYGYSEEEMIGNSISILLPKKLSDNLDQIMGKIKKGESIKHHDSVRLKKDGKLIDVSLYISPIFDSNGNVTGASTIAHDITDRKMLEKELKESEEKIFVRYLTMLTMQCSFINLRVKSQGNFLK